MAQAHAIHPRSAAADFRLGVLLVAGAAIAWSFGGTIARFITVQDSWTVVFWRALFASSFLLLFMLWRDGPQATVQMFRGMGWAGLGVACCFGIASSCFVVALQYTTVANILLTQAAAPLFAALLAWMVFGERVNARDLGRHRGGDLRRGHHGVGLLLGRRCRPSVTGWRWSSPCCSRRRSSSRGIIRRCA